MGQRTGGRIASWILGLVCIPGLAVAPVRGQSDDGQKAYQRVLKSTVWILAKKGAATASGTGSLIDKTHRLVVTNYHVAGDADKLVVVFPEFAKGKPISERTRYMDRLRSGGGINAKLLHVDQTRDLAVIQLEQVPKDVLALPLSKGGASVGQTVHSIGNPGRSDFLWEYTSGTVRQLGQKKWRARDGNKVLSFEAKVIETQSPTNPGDSGGPLVNSQAELVGVTQGMAADAQLLSLFIDVSEVKSFLNSKRLLPRSSDKVVRADGEEKAKTAGENPTTPTDTEKAEKDASRKLNFAKTLAGDGKLEKAKDRCEEIIKSYPNTSAATEAKLLLEKLNK
jgi:S1-C subfamily serine protease